jgi:hypothetical protein
MAILVAPVTVQLSVLLVPELMLVGSAVKEEIVGAAIVPEAELGEVVELQAVSPAQVSTTRTRARRSSFKEYGPVESR